MGEEAYSLRFGHCGKNCRADLYRIEPTVPDFFIYVCRSSANPSQRCNINLISIGFLKPTNRNSLLMKGTPRS